MEINRLGNQADRLAGAGDIVGEQAPAARADRLRANTAQEAGYDRAVAADSVEISDAARLLARAQRAVEAAPDLREEKIARLKQQIADGTYRVPAELLARRLLGEI
jgi:negative regulator of flagellin synthesis FlgM